MYKILNEISRLIIYSMLLTITVGLMMCNCLSMGTTNWLESMLYKSWIHTTNQIQKLGWFIQTIKTTSLILVDQTRFIRKVILSIKMEKGRNIAIWVLFVLGKLKFYLIYQLFTKKWKMESGLILCMMMRLAIH